MTKVQNTDQTQMKNRTSLSWAMTLLLTASLGLPACGGDAGKSDKDETGEEETGEVPSEGEETDGVEEKEKSKDQEKSEEDESKEEEESSTGEEGSEGETTTDTTQDETTSEAPDDSSSGLGGLPSLDIEGVLSSLLGGGTNT